MVCHSRVATNLRGVAVGIRVGAKRQPWWSDNVEHLFNLQLGT